MRGLRKLRDPDAVKPWGLSTRARLRELERENHELRMKAEFLSKTVAHLCARTSTAVPDELVDAEQGAPSRG